MNSVFGAAENGKVDTPAQGGGPDPADIALGYVPAPNPSPEDHPAQESEVEGDQEPENQGEQDADVGEAAADGEQQAQQPQQGPEGQPQQPTEVDSLRQQLQQYEAALMQMAQYMHGQGIPLQAPAQGWQQASVPTLPGWGQYPPNAYQELQAPVVPQEGHGEEKPALDLDKLKEQFWDDPVAASQTLAEHRAREMLEQELAKREVQLGQALRQVLQPIMQTVQQMQFERQHQANLYNQVERAKASYSDFQDVAGEMRKIFKENPDLQYLPDAIDRAYRMAKERGGGTSSPAPQQGGQNLKKAARMPRGPGQRGQNHRDPNDMLVEQALGPLGGGGGIWD